MQSLLGRAGSPQIDMVHAMQQQASILCACDKSSNAQGVRVSGSSAGAVHFAGPDKRSGRYSCEHSLHLEHDAAPHQTMLGPGHNAASRPTALSMRGGDTGCESRSVHTQLHANPHCAFPDG